MITELRRGGDATPILVLTARVRTTDKVRGLDLGADDYLTKPFAVDELLARVRRRMGVRARGPVRFGRYLYDQERRGAFDAQSGTVVLMSSKEEQLLAFFLVREGRIVTRERILDAVWGGDYEGTDRTVDNFVSALRRKFGAGHFQTVRGEGYRFVMEP